MSNPASMTSSAGLAIFVKTPGHSPLKTRLAAGIGNEAAREFHLLAAAAVAAVARAACARHAGLVACWAVAEHDALDDPHWRSLPRIAQGEGDLGARMQHVCDGLQRRHGRALLLGADAPQLQAEDLLAALRALDAQPHVIGPGSDGGFWLFGTRAEVPTAAWTDTPWSQTDTAQRFVAALAAAGESRVARLRELRDVDSAEDLAPLRAALDALAAPLPEQTRLGKWLRSQAGL